MTIMVSGRQLSNNHSVLEVACASSQELIDKLPEILRANC